MIEQAKAEYAKKNAPPAQKQPETSGEFTTLSLYGIHCQPAHEIEIGSVITDPNDDRFDLEAFLKMKAEEK